MKTLLLPSKARYPPNVRSWQMNIWQTTFGFNPRTHWGATDRDRTSINLNEFQSTHPHGVRPRIQQKAEYHIAKVYNLRRKTKIIILKEIKAKK